MPEKTVKKFPNRRRENDPNMNSWSIYGSGGALALWRLSELLWKVPQTLKNCAIAASYRSLFLAVKIHVEWQNCNRHRRRDRDRQGNRYLSRQIGGKSRHHVAEFSPYRDHRRRARPPWLDGDAPQNGSAGQERGPTRCYTGRR